MERIVFHLPSGDLPVSESAILYFELARSLPDMVTNAVGNATERFLEYLLNHAHLPSEYFSRQDFESIEGASEEVLRKLFGQIIETLAKFLLRDANLSTWLGGVSSVSRFLEPKFSYGTYREKCESEILLPLAKKVEKYVASLDFSASIASRKVHHHRNAETGIVGAIYHGLKESGTKNDFCKKCDAKFRDCANAAVSLVRKRLPKFILELANASLVDGIGVVNSDMNIVEFRDHIKTLFSDSESSDMLFDALRFLPYEPLVIRCALSAYGDREKIISNVATIFGVNAEKEKCALIEDVVWKLERADERTTYNIKIEFEQKVSALCLECPNTLEKFREKVLSAVNCHDKKFRTVSNVMFPTRIEASMTRNDVEYLSKLLGEDVLPCVKLMSREHSLAQRIKDLCPCCRKKSGEILARCSNVLEEIRSKTVKSPFLCLVERALLHSQDVVYYAANDRFETEEEAKTERTIKRDELRMRIRAKGVNVDDFQLNTGVWLKLKIRGLLCSMFKNIEDPFEHFLIQRFLGDTLPDDVRTLRDILQWQLGLDFIEPTEMSFMEISPEGLPKGYVSLAEEFEDHGSALLDDSEVLMNLPRFSCRPYRACEVPKI